MKKWFKFIKQSLSHPQQVGAFCASSRPMGFTMTDAIEIEKAGSIVEIGPGDGVFTQVICERKAENADFMAVEINPEFCEVLTERFPGVKVKNGCASTLGEMLREEGMAPPEAVISALPWSVFPDELQDKLLGGVVEAMAPGGAFSSIAYISGLWLPAARKFRKKLDSTFARVDVSRIQWRNLPPAVTYRCWKAE